MDFAHYTESMPRPVKVTAAHASSISRQLNQHVGVLTSVQHYPNGVKVRVSTGSAEQVGFYLLSKGYKFTSKTVSPTGGKPTPAQLASPLATVTEFIITSRKS